MMDNGKREPRRQLSPEGKWEVFLEVTSQEISQADAARKYGVDVSVIVRLRALAKHACDTRSWPVGSRWVGEPQERGDLVAYGSDRIEWSPIRRQITCGSPGWTSGP